MTEYHCYKDVQQSFQILLGSVAADMRWGGRSYIISFFCSSNRN